jgi:homoserine O-acetyltransferase
VKARTLVAGINSDRLFPISGQAQIAENLSCELVGGELQVIESEFGHDGFLIERDIVGPLLTQLLEG